MLEQPRELARGVGRGLAGVVGALAGRPASGADSLVNQLAGTIARL
jgi:hypothetical protein